MASDRIRILHLEDLRSDNDLVKFELKRSGMSFDLVWVSNKASFEKALDAPGFDFDIILSDHSLPTITSSEAFRLVKQKHHQAPFILLTATVSEEFAVNMMKEGVYDYILKDRMQRLPNAILKAIEKNNLEKEKEKYFTEIVQHNKNLEQFAYIISHNLRSPVANILGLSNLLSGWQKMSKEDFKKCLDGLTMSIQKLDDIIIDLNSILQKREEVHEKKELVNIRALVADIETLISDTMEKGNVTIKTSTSEVEDIFTLRSYLHSIFLNIITNSIKYARPGVPPVITIQTAGAGGRLIISFRDNGLGIDMKTHGDKLFGLYKKFHPHIEGKGLGLYIVRTQVELLGGKISAESEVGKGTRFEIELPDQRGTVFS